MVVGVGSTMSVSGDMIAAAAPGRAVVVTVVAAAELVEAAAYAKVAARVGAVSLEGVAAVMVVVMRAADAEMA